MKTNKKFIKSIIRAVVWATIMIVGPVSVQISYAQLSPANFDGAPVLEPGQIETSLFVTGTYVSDSELDGVYIKGYIPGIKIGFGITRNFDLKLAYSRGIYKYKFYEWTGWEDSKGNIISLSPKVSFLDGILAVKVPFSVIMYYDDNANELKANYLISPRFIVSLHIKQYAEISASPFFEISIPGSGGDPFYYVGGNIGFAFSSDLKRWAVRPEAFLSYPIPNDNRDSGTLIYGWGLAFNFNFDAFKPK